MQHRHTVIGVNYHRIGHIDPDNPLHRLHTVPRDVFDRQLDHMQQLGKVVSLDDVRACRNLAEVNFVISFDDVPLAARAGIERVLDRQLPVVLSVCGHLATHGWGTRDLVYCIEKYTDPDRIARHVRAHLPADVVGAGPLSFYHLTKRDDLDPDRVRAHLIEPLFNEVEPRARRYLQEGGYLGWEGIGDLASSPLVTVASHGWSHANLAASSRAQLHADIALSHETSTRRLGHTPRYFTVPFGRYYSRIAVDCVNLLHEYGYHGILWVGDASNLIRGPYHHQLLQLTRLHTPTTFDEFAAQVKQLRRNPLDAVVWQAQPRTHRRPVTLTESSDPQRAARHEMIVRQGKDYASDPRYYRYQFTDNPYRGNRPDFYAIECDGRIEAAAYNFHSLFRLQGVDVPGVYLSNWRKLPDSHATAAGMLVQRMTRREPVVGVYHPSPQAAQAFHSWHRVPTWRLTLTTEGTGTAPLSSPHRVVELDRFDEALTPLCDDLVAETDFSLVRDRTYHRWRHDAYPLASCRYLLLLHDEQPVGYAVALRRHCRVSIADWYATGAHGYLMLAAAAVNHARDLHATTMELETSNRTVAEQVSERFGASTTRCDNLYHLNPTRLAEHGINPASLRWDELRLHETGTTSDVLIR